MAAFEKRRHEKTGRLFYGIKVRFKGAPPQSKSFERPTDARNWAAAELIDRYIKARTTEEKGDERNRGAQLASWKTQLGHLKLSDVTRAILNHRDTCEGDHRKGLQLPLKSLELKLACYCYGAKPHIRLHRAAAQ
jgi:hypothetical protein